MFLVRLIAIDHVYLCKEEGRCVLFNDALNTFYLRLYGVGHMVKNHSDRERENLLLLSLLAWPSTIFSVSHVAPWKKQLPWFRLTI